MANAKTRSIVVRPAHAQQPRRAYWQGVLEEWRRSGLSQAEFCRRRGILAGTLAFWKHTIGREAGAAARAARSMLAGPDARPTFLPVRIAPSAPSPAAPTTMSTGGADGIEIVLSHGRLVRVRGPVEARWLGQVLVMLETPRC